MSRPRRNFQTHLLYHVVQRGNKGQWVFLDDEDFAFSRALLRKKADQYRVIVHDYCLTHSQGHWLLQPRTKTGISCLMRDMQSQTSKYLNRKYKHRPWRLFTPLGTDDDTGRKSWRARANPLKNGVNWAPRFYATAIEPCYREAIIKYIGEGPVRAGLCTRADVYRWSGARETMRGAESLNLVMMDKGVRPGPTIVHHRENPEPGAPVTFALQTAFAEASHRRMEFSKVLERVRTGPEMGPSGRIETAVLISGQACSPVSTAGPSASDASPP